MAKADKDIDAILKEMHNSNGVAKGDPGERAVLKICEEFYQQQGGILYHSYEYTTDRELPGNVKKDENTGNLYIENLGSTTEIDVLLVTPFRVFPIEVKAYRAKKITFTDKEIAGCRVTSKSPVHQNEMHCRHLYSSLFKALPNGDTSYIVPLVVLVDKCTVVDERSDWQKEYIKICTLNTLRKTLIQYNTPGDFKLNLTSVDNTLKDIRTSYNKYLTVRI